MIVKSDEPPLLLGPGREEDPPLISGPRFILGPVEDKCTIGGPQGGGGEPLRHLSLGVLSRAAPGEEEVPRDIQAAGARGPPRLPVAALIGTIYVRRGSTVFSPRLLDQRPLEFSSFRFARLTIPSLPGGRGRGGGGRDRGRGGLWRWFSIDLVLRIRVEFNDSFRGGGEEEVGGVGGCNREKCWGF